MTNTSAQASIVCGPPGRAINVSVALRQIGTVTLRRVGFHDLMFDHDYVKFRVACDGCRKFWCIVKLAADDTYSIEFGRLVKFDWRIAAQLEGVYGDVLGETIERLYQEVYE